MNVTTQVKKAVEQIPTDYVFSYTDIRLPMGGKGDTIVRLLNRMAAAGDISKLSKGKFYKPRQTRFGALKPTPYQIAKDFIEKDGKLVGYVTGYSAFNDMCLTTQISNCLEIGTNKYRRTIKRGMYTISFIYQPNEITRENIELLRILDAMRFVKGIPAATPDEACARLITICGELSPERRTELSDLALKYTNYVRALCGAILETVGAKWAILNKLRDSLNVVTSYNLYISESTLPNKKEWNIV
jgi:hypothetical protein